jgi:arsenite-transporting ATPase
VARGTRLSLFGGKGGAGKTTCAAAAALAAAEIGRRVLIVSTDPAHSLGDALRARLSGEPSQIETRRGTLFAAELAAASALDRWRREHRPALREVAARGTYLDTEDIERFLDLALPGADELMAWLEIDRLAGETACEEIVVDTAPTAHTLRLLAMPAALRRAAEILDRMQARHRLMAERFGAAWQPDESDALIADLEARSSEIEAKLRDPRQTSLVWVMLPEALSLAETRDALASLDESGLPVREVIVNRVLPADAGACSLCRERRLAEAEAIREIREALADRQLRFVPEMDKEPRGRLALRKIAGHMESRSRGMELLAAQRSETSPPGPLSTKWRGGKKLRWMDEIAPSGVRLLFFGGKGGVGKTTCAAAFALVLAERRPEMRVLLLSTDPAHSVADVLEIPLGDDERPVQGAPAGLRARELDAGRAFAAWRGRHGQAAGDAVETFTAQGAGVGELLDMSPPGLDELVALATLLDAVVDGEGAFDLVVVDTAPTGHALRLLEMPELALSWDHYLLSLLLKYREAVGLGRLAAELVELSRSLKRLQALLRDSERARFVAVTRASELPRRETARLLRSLGKLAVAVPAIVVNAVPPDGCDRCGGSGGALGTLQDRLARLPRGRCAIMKAPAAFPPPRGVRRLAEWARTWERISA